MFVFEYNNAGATEPIVIDVQIVKSNLSFNFDDENIEEKNEKSDINIEDVLFDEGISMCPVTDVTNGFGIATRSMRNF